MGWTDRRTNIQKLIDETGIDSHILADKIHISYSLLRKYASGNRPASKYACKALASFFRVSEDVILGKCSIFKCEDLIDWNTIINAVTNWEDLSPAIKSIIEGKISSLFSDLFYCNKGIQIITCLCNFSKEGCISRRYEIYPICAYIVFEDGSVGLMTFFIDDFTYYISEIQIMDNYNSFKKILGDLYTYEFGEEFDEYFEWDKLGSIIKKYCLYKYQDFLDEIIEEQVQLIL